MMSSSAASTAWRKISEGVKHAQQQQPWVFTLALVISFVAFILSPSVKMMSESIWRSHVVRRLESSVDSERKVLERMNLMIGELKSGTQSIEVFQNELSREWIRAGHKGGLDLCGFSESHLWKVLSMPHFCGLQQPRYFHADRWLNWTGLYSEFSGMRGQRGSSCVLACTYDQPFGCSQDTPCVHAYHIRNHVQDVLQLREYYEWNRISFLKRPFELYTILDGGAGVGISTVLLASIYPGSAIIATELDKTKFELLQKNVKPYRHVTTLLAIPWPSTRLLSLMPLPPGSSQAYSLLETSAKGGVQTTAESSTQVQGLSIQFLLKVFGLRAFHVLKLEREVVETGIVARDVAHKWLLNVKLALLGVLQDEGPGLENSIQTFFSTNNSFHLVPGVTREYQVYQRSHVKLE